MSNPYTAQERTRLAIERGIIVDPEDAWLLAAFTWRIENGYARTDGGTHPYKWKMFLHHCIMGQPIDGSDIDHIDRARHNNSRSNLRYVSRTINKLNTQLSDEAYHIQLTANGCAYMVKIKRKQIQYYVGTYETIEEAEAARDKWLVAWEMQHA
jgi:hypothetical protein